MPRLWKRSAAVEIDGRRFPIGDFDLSFSVTNSIDTSANQAEVTIWNLNETTRNALKKGQRLSIEAGYESAKGWIFAGDIVRPSNVLVPGEGWQTKIQAGDGHKGLRNTMNVSIAPGARVGDILEQIGRAGGFSLDSLKAAIARGDIAGAVNEFKNGMNLSGTVKQELEKLGRTTGTNISVQRNELLVQKPGDADKTRATLLNEATGMIGSPERIFDEKQPGLVIAKVVSLLNSKIVPHHVVVVDSKVLPGNFKITRVQHDGGNKQNEWYSVAEGYEIAGKVVTSG